MIPDTLTIICDYCGHTWQEPLATFKAKKAMVYKGDNDTVKRRILCPNCDKWNVVKLNKAWLDDE